MYNRISHLLIVICASWLIACNQASVTSTKVEAIVADDAITISNGSKQPVNLQVVIGNKFYRVHDISAFMLICFELVIPFKHAYTFSFTIRIKSSIN